MVVLEVALVPIRIIVHTKKTVKEPKVALAHLAVV